MFVRGEQEYCLGRESQHGQTDHVVVVELYGGVTEDNLQ